MNSNRLRGHLVYSASTELCSPTDSTPLYTTVSRPSAVEILLYHFQAADDTVSLQVESFLEDTDRGIFATRAPHRLNSIGLSVVDIDSVTDNEVTVEGIDVVNGTPLLDIKPFVPQFDVPDDIETRWLDTSKYQSNRSEPMTDSSGNLASVLFLSTDTRSD